MGVFVIFYSLLWAGIGWFVGKHPETIAGYNTMRNEKRRNVDIQAVGNLVRKGFRVMSVAMVVLWFSLRLSGQPVRVAILGLFASVFIGTPVLLLSVRKHDKNPRGGWKYYLTAGVIFSLFLAAAAYVMLKPSP